MWWWIGAVLAWLISFVWILYVMTDVVRGKTSNVKAIPGYLFHGATAVLALWLLMKALGA